MSTKRIPRIALLVLAGLVLARFFATQPWLSIAVPASANAAEISIDPQAVPVSPPPFKDEDMFPCSDCHDGEEEVDTTPRELEMAHEDIVLEHDRENHWCMSCHDADNRDKLHSASGELIDFAQSYKLCGQCHGSKYRDWQAGVHGKRTGSWNGEKRYLLCAHCHDPHSPSFKPLEPLAAPTRPEELR